MDLELVLKRAVELGASDIHLKVERPPIVRRDGSLGELEGEGRAVLAVAVGTVFTVRANPWESTVHVSVEEGTVETWPDSASTNSKPHIVTAGQSVDYPIAP